MNTFKAELNKIILALTSVGLILLMLPASLSADHFRYGTMSWELVDFGTVNQDNDTIRLKMENGWTANHGAYREQVDYTGGNGGIWVPGHIGSIKYNYITINWTGESSQTVDIKIKSRDNTTIRNTNCSSGCIDSTISEMGDYASSTWTLGRTHDYDNGTYIVYWDGQARATVANKEDGYSTNGTGGNSNRWRNETMVRIGGDYVGNVSPVSAVPSDCKSSG